MVSIGTMIRTIAGLAGTDDVSSRTSEFINSIVESSDEGTFTPHLTEKQVKWVEDIYRKHFGD